MRTVKHVVALLLVVSILVPILPISCLAEGVAYAAGQASSWHATSMEWVLAAAEGGDRLQGGEWEYVLLDEGRYAVITGHSGSDAQKLSAPAMLGGADVVGLAAGALADHTALESLALPGNLMAIGGGAIPGGVVVEGYNASYAQDWARSNRYAFRSLSQWDFMDGVVDYADIRGDAFVRVSRSEVRLRALEASRLQAGSLFFLLDPDNPYQVSYYKVDSVAEADASGFVTVHCTTPVIEEFFRSVELKDAPLIADPDSFQAAEGVEITAGTMESALPFSARSASEGLSFSQSLMNLSFSTEIGKHGKFTADAQLNVSGKTNTTVKNNKTTIANTFTFKGSVSGKLSVATGNLLQTPPAGYDSYDEMYKLMKEYAELKNESVGSEGYEVTLGRVMMCSVGGIVNVYLNYGLYIEFSGSAEISYTFSYTTTTMSVDGKQTINNEGKPKSDLKFSAEGKFKFGFQIAVEADIFIVKAIEVNLFLGVQITATLDPSTTDPIDMLDTIALSGKILFEASLELGFDLPAWDKMEITKSLKFTPVKPLKLSLTLFEWAPEWASWHFHLMPTDSQNNKKNQIHQSDDCPYGKLSASFVMPFLPKSDANYNWPVDISTPANPERNPSSLEPGDRIDEPDTPDLSGYSLTFEGWYLDSAYTEPVSWPFHMPNHDVTFYGRAVSTYVAYFYMADGTEAAEPIACGENQTFTLPAGRNGYVIDGWVGLEGTDLHSRTGEYTLVGAECTMPSHNLYFLADCQNDVEAHFYTGSGVIDRNISLFRDASLDAPSESEVGSQPKYTFAGWKDAAGKEVSFPITLEYGASRHQYYYAVWNYREAVTEPKGTGLSIFGSGTSYGGASQSGQDYFYFSAFDNTNLTCHVSGYKSSQTRTYTNADGKLVTESYTVDPVDITVPSSYLKTNSDGTTTRYTVIGVSGLSGWATLNSVTLPSTIRSIGASCFAGSPKLYAIHMSSTSVSVIPDSFARNCPNLSSVSFPGELTAIGSYAFAGCTSITGATLGAPIGSNAFDGCTRLAEAELGGGVTSIGSYAFKSCGALTSLRIPDSVQSIGNGFLSGCLKLHTLDFDGRPATITKSMMTIGAGSLLENVTLGDGVLKVDTGAFSNGGNGFTALKSLSMSMSVKTIGSEAFKGSGLEELTLESYDLTIGANAFSGNQLKRVTVKGGILSAYAFAGCAGLQEVTLGHGVSIGDYAFSGCIRLDDPDLGGAVRIGDYAFQNCTGLHTLECPDSVTYYGKYMIQGCMNLERLVIGGGCSRLVNYDVNYTDRFVIGAGNKLSYLEIREGVTEIGQRVFGNSSYSGERTFPNLATVILPQSLTTIGYQAFYGAGIQDLTIRGNIDDWGDEAFAGSKTQTLTVNGKVGNGAFKGCTTLEEVTISGNGPIGGSAFKGCSALTTVTLNEGVTSIGDSAFRNCSSLRALECPDSVTYYGLYMIEGCKNLERLVIGGGCSRLVNYDTSYTDRFGIGVGNKLSYLEIREGVMEIGRRVFGNPGYYSECSFPNLATVILPQSLTAIGYQAFYGAGIQDMTIRGNIATWGDQAFAGSKTQTLTVNGKVGNGAFKYCTTLEEVTISGPIGSNAFEGCSALTMVTLNEGVTSIGDSAFRNCSSLRALACPDSVTYYGKYMIEGCMNLERLVIGGGCSRLANADTTYSDRFGIGAGNKLSYLEIREGVTEIGPRVFGNPGYYSECSFPNLATVILPQSLTAIGYQAFYGAGIQDLTIRGAVASWGSEAFAGSSIETLKAYGNIGDSAFAGCKTLKRATLGGPGTVLGNNAFSGCTALETVTLQEGVVRIGDSAFKNCSSLRALECPDSVTYYGKYMIDGCMNLERLVIGGGCSRLANADTTYSDRFKIGAGNKLSYLEIREGVTEIGQRVFGNPGYYSECSFPNLATVILPQSLTAIGYQAFYGAGIQDLTIRGNVASWGSEAFAGSKTQTLTVSGKVGNGAFKNCKSLKEVTISGPIGGSAFEGCSALTNVTLNEGVTSIGDYAFRNCSSLRALACPDSVTYYGKYMIEGCMNLEHLVIGGGCSRLANADTTYSDRFKIGAGNKLSDLEIREGVTEIGPRVFGNPSYYSECSFSNLATVTLPQSLTTIGYQAFYGAGIQDLTIRGAIASWGSEAFAGSKLETLRANGTIGSAAFRNCKTLRTATLGGTGRIEASAFAGCSALESVTIGEGITSIGSNAFDGCGKLWALECPDSVTSYGQNMINGCVNLKRLVIGGGCRELSYAPFSIGAGSTLEYVQIREGVESLAAYTLANANGSGASYSRQHTKLTTLVLPESLTSIGNDNLNTLPALEQLICGSNVAAIGSGSALSTTGAAIFSLTFNSLLQAIADSTDSTYTYGGKPGFCLTTLASCDGSLIPLDARQVTMDEPLPLPEVDMAGWQAEGWYADEACTLRWTCATMPACDLTLYVKLAPVAAITWLVDAAEEGAEAAEEPGWFVYARDEAVAGSAVTCPKPALENRTFDGWYTDETLTVRWIGGNVPAEGLTLYGHFAPQYEAEFVLVYPDGTTEPYCTALYNGAMTVTAPDDPVIPGYALERWYSDAALVYPWTSGVMTSSGMRLYGRLVRLTAGGVYRPVEDGLALVRYALEEDEGSEVYLPAKVDGVPVVAIDAYAFEDAGITQLRLPDGLLRVDEHAFDGADTLSILRISTQNEVFAARDGVLYSKDMTALIRYPEGKTTVDFTMPASVASMTPGAFRHAAHLKTAGFPAGLTRVPEEAFSGCTGLTSVTLPDSVTALGEGAFSGCHALERFTAYGLLELGEGCLPISSRTQVTGPLGVGVLREYCMTTVDGAAYFSMPYNQCTLTLYVNGEKAGAMYGEKGVPVNAAMLRALIEGFDGLGSIAGDAADVLETPDGRIITGWYTDAGCTAAWDLAEGCLPGDMTLYTQSIAKLTYVISDFVTGTQTDGEGNETPVTQQGLLLTGYYGKDSHVVLPDAIDGVYVLGLGAGLMSHANGPVASISIGRHVVSIDETALDDPDGHPFAGTLLTDPGSWAEAWAAGQALEHGDRQYTLSFVTYGASMKPVQAAGGTCIRVATPVRTGAQFVGWYLDETLETAAELINGTLFTMPAADTVLYAAWTLSGEQPEYRFIETDSGAITLTGYTGSSRVWEIPGQINGLPVTAIGDEAFAGEMMTRVTLPDSVTTIGDHAFDGCSRLTSLTMGAVETIGEGAFMDCATLAGLTLPDTVRSIGEYAFSGCNSLTSVALGSRLTTLEAHTFDECAALRSVQLGSGLETVKPGAFWRCPRLTEITVEASNPALSAEDGILYTRGMDTLLVYPQGRSATAFTLPDGVTGIAARAFANAGALGQIVLTGDAYALGDGAFQNCTGLLSFELPEGCAVSEIPKGAFSGCTALESVTLNSTVQAIRSQAFAHCPALERAVIRESTTCIEDLAFGSSRALTIVGRTGSAADMYALLHDIDFTDPDAAEITALAITGEAVMQRGEVQQLALEWEPEDAADAARITWESSNPAVARVTDGFVQALAGGTAVITASARNGVKATLTLEVQVAVQRLEMRTGETNAARGLTLQAECGVFPASATNQTLSWSSSDEQVAVVDGNGLITMLAQGDAVITATSHNALTAQLQVHVYHAVERVVPDSDTLTLCALGEASSAKPVVTIEPEDATNKALTWTSLTPDVATVDQGVITAVGLGEADIVVASADPLAASAAIHVTVEKLNLAEATCEIDGGSTYTGSEQPVAVELTADGAALTQGVHYTLTPERVTNAGAYSLTITGIGLCEGDYIYEPYTVNKATPVITWLGSDTVAAGVFPDLSTFSVSPAVCAVSASLLRVASDGTLEKVPADSAPGAGQYIIRLSVDESDNWHAATLNQPIALLELSASARQLTLTVGQTVRLAAGLAGSSLLAGEEVTWESADPSVATVDASGIVHGIAAGQTDILLSHESCRAICHVTVEGTLDSRMQMPGALKTICEEAFVQTDAQVIALPQSIASIGSRAFADSTALRQVICPGTNAEPAPDILQHSELAVMICPEGSACAERCWQSGVPFVLSLEDRGQ